MDAEASFKDRSFGLLLFGAFEIMLGLGSLCMAPLAVLGMWMGQQQSGGMPLSAYTIASVVINYGGIGLGLCVLGVGSWRARRWAQRLNLALGITWLACGIGGMIVWLMMLPVFPEYMRAVMASYPSGAMPDNMITVSMIAGTVLIGVLYILLPLPIALFYAGRNVAATCRWYDPKPRWTDRVPVPVLMAVIVWGATGVFMLAFLVGPFPAMGTVLTGPAAGALALVLSAVFLSLAYGLTTLRMRWWWLMAVMTIVMMANGATMFQPDVLTRYYTLLGLPPEQGQAFSILTHSTPIWIAGACAFAVYAGFILWLRRYFNGGRGPMGPDTITG